MISTAHVPGREPGSKGSACRSEFTGQPSPDKIGIQTQQNLAPQASWRNICQTWSHQLLNFEGNSQV